MDIKFEDGQVVIRIPVTQEIIDDSNMTSSNKSKLVATTSGFAPVQSPFPKLRVSLNLIAGLPKEGK